MIRFDQVQECVSPRGVQVARRYAIAVLAVVFMIGACGGSGGDGTTIPGSEDPTGTTAAMPDTTGPDGDGPSVGPGDIPQECIDAFVEYLHALEPVLADFDFDNATMADFEAVSIAIEAATGDLEDPPECDDLDIDAGDDESIEYLIDLARDEAPATVPYFEMVRDFMSSGDGTGDGNGTDDSDGAQASGECEADIAALQALVDAGGTVQDLSFADLAAVASLSASIGLNCTPDRASEFFSQEDVKAFLEG